MSSAFTPLEIFILALLRGGINTIYLLYAKVGLSFGGIRAALAHLERDRLIQRTAHGKRKKRIMRLTEKGGGAFAAACTDTTADITLWDLDAVLRAFWASLQVSNECGRRLLDRVVSQRRTSAAEFAADANRLASKTGDSIAAFHCWRATCKARVLTAEAEILEEIGAQIEPARLLENAPQPAATAPILTEYQRKNRPPLRLDLMEKDTPNTSPKVSSWDDAPSSNTEKLD
jgi:hypothetical protein